jgi:hypothetical protein
MATSKASKKDQPKRKRYNAEGRGKARKLRMLQKHVEKYPNDLQAKNVLSGL